MICYNDQDLEQAKIRIKEATEATDYLIIEQKLKRLITTAFNMLML